MKISSLEQIVVGKAMYYVHILPDTKYISEYVFTSTAYEHKNSVLVGWWVRTRHTESKFEIEMSLHDANVLEPNGYNEHAMFTTRESAEEYMKNTECSWSRDDHRWTKYDDSEYLRHCWGE